MILLEILILGNALNFAHIINSENRDSRISDKFTNSRYSNSVKKSKYTRFDGILGCKINQFHMKGNFIGLLFRGAKEYFKLSSDTSMGKCKYRKSHRNI